MNQPTTKPHPDDWLHEYDRRVTPFVRLALLSLVIVVAILGWEIRSARFQAHHLSQVAQKSGYKLKLGPSDSIRFPSHGPYDERLGYTRLEKTIGTLVDNAYAVEAQSRMSETLLNTVELGLFPTYQEKTQAGLSIEDRFGKPLFTAAYPENAYESFDRIPRLIVDSLAFIENRELLAPNSPRQNPAVEWPRLVLATMSYGRELINPEAVVPGGSTLATQMEKFRHSPDGVTASPADKIKQIASASLRAYRYGHDTTEARQRIATDYINSIALAAVPDHGEVIGLPNGLTMWYGVDHNEVSRLLRTNDSNAATLPAKARAFKQTLSLLLAAKKPSLFLRHDPGALHARTEHFLKMLAEEGVISEALSNAALSTPIALNTNYPKLQANVIGTKAESRGLRRQLLPLLGVDGYYALDRMDMTVESTLDGDINRRVKDFLESIADPATARKLALVGPRMINTAGSQEIALSFSLYETGDGYNRVRVFADNRSGAVNDTLKLDLGSTAKLRTVVTYLEIIARAYDKYADESVRLAPVPASTDVLSRWVFNELRRRPNSTLADILDRAMNREYSASPHERFKTGGGLHKFSNFDKDDNGRRLTVSAALQRSTNLVFIRLMRDVLQHYLHAPVIDAPAVLGSRTHHRRDEYLRRFAKREARAYVDRFWKRYHSKTETERIETIIRRAKPTPKRLAVILRSVKEDIGREEFAAIERKTFKGDRRWNLSDELLQELHETYTTKRFDLMNRSYLSKVHPLELWTLNFLQSNPDVTRSEILEESKGTIDTVYRWLLYSRRKSTADARIREELERQAFALLHEDWKDQGYAFGSLVPSLATAIGTSADRPSSLADLMGLIVNGGVRYPARVFDRIRLAEQTPYMTVMKAGKHRGERVLHPETAQVLREVLTGVVANGTARRAFGAVTDAAGSPLIIGGKTGTGDHLRKTVDKHGNVTKTTPVSRSATFTFFIGPRHYGVLTAYVLGETSGDYEFTSSLATQIFKHLGPIIQPIVTGEKTPSSPERTIVEADSRDSANPEDRSRDVAAAAPERRRAFASPIPHQADGSSNPS